MKIVKKKNGVWGKLVLKKPPSETIDKLARLLADAFAGKMPKVHQAVKAAGYSDWIVGSQTEVAEFFGCHAQSVKLWAADGMPHEKKHYDLRKIVRWWFEKSKSRLGSDEEVKEAKRRKLAADAENAELKAKRTKRELVSRVEIEEVLTKLATALAEQLQGLADKDSSLNTEQRASLRTEIGKFLNGFRIQGDKAVDEQFKPTN